MNKYSKIRNVMNPAFAGFAGKVFLASILSFTSVIVLSAQEVRRITYNNRSVDIVVDRPANHVVDVLIAFPGTVATNDQTLPAAQNIVARVKEITTRTDMMIIGVAYPQQGILLGDGIAEAEAALLWIREKGRKSLKRKIRKIFLIGHSQGGYMVTRLNTMHATNGVIANAPGPLNLVYRCGLEENSQAPPSAVCNLLRQNYGTTAANPGPYMTRSLLSFTSGHRSDILFVQGMQDSPIQLASWPTFKTQINECSNCQSRQFLDVAGAGHTALFDNSEAIAVYNSFINR